MGVWCVIDSYKKQKKTSKYRLINWLYKKIYGYEEISFLPEGVDVLYYNNELHFRDEKTYKTMLKELIIPQQYTI